jgi:hypothetical protein
LIKNQVSNVFKFEWITSPVSTNNNNTAEAGAASTDSPNTTLQVDSSAALKTPATSTLKKSRRLNKKKLDQSIQETIANTSKDLPPPTDIQFNDLLDIDFGTPFNIYNEFNILHPYLSLYYLDYFTGINKMNTKLYCTTALMMSMMKDNREDPSAADKDAAQLDDDEEQYNQTVESGGNRGNNPPRRTSQVAQEPTNIGYTIGATNALFKQRLYDDVDAFIDELDIDMHGNETLKKQLQLTTADLRFIDFIVKNVNTAKNGDKQQLANNTPTLLSFKKIISTNNLDAAAAASNGTTSSVPHMMSTGGVSSPLSTKAGEAGHNQNINQVTSNWEGSDDWIRLNFKWYMYSLLGCLVKEDLSNAIRAELEAILFSNELATLSSSSGESNSSKNSSTLSINEKSAAAAAAATATAIPKSDVVNIDDYIERVNNTNAVSSTELSGEKSSAADLASKASELTKSSTTISTLSVLSNQYFYCLEELNSYLDYRDDFNVNYIGELRKTTWFKGWHELNRVKLEKSLYKFDLAEVEALLEAKNSANLSSSNGASTGNGGGEVAAVSTSTTSAVILANKFNVLFTKYQELELTRLHHPFNGTMSVSDIKLKFNFLFQGTESGRKFNKALTEGGKIVNHTSRAVGDALSHAKSTFSSFFNSWSSSGSSSPSKASASAKSNTKN